MSNCNSINVAMETIQLCIQCLAEDSLLTSSFTECFRKRIVGDLELRHFLILVGCHSDEGRLRKVPHQDGFGCGSSRGTFLVLFDNQPQKVLVHRVQQNLEVGGREREKVSRCLQGADILCTLEELECQEGMQAHLFL